MKGHRYTGQQPATKSARGPIDKLLVNRRFCSPTGVHRISFVRPCEESFRTVFYIALVGQRGRWLPRPPKCRHFVRPSVAPPRRPPCDVPTRTARCVSRFWTRQVQIQGHTRCSPGERSCLHMNRTPSVRGYLFCDVYKSQNNVVFLCSCGSAFRKTRGCA